ncbi:MAG: sterol desaturase family protein [Alphaproteobacteria bacterium]
MVDLLTTILRETLGVLFNPGHFLSVLPLIVAFVAAFVIVMMRRRKMTAGPLSLRRTMLMLFPRRIFLHKSALLDYAVFAINQIVLIFLTISAVFSPALFSAIIIEIGRSVGVEPQSADSSLAIRVTYSIFLVLLWDFSATYAHYLKHRIPVLWELHKVHHSAEVMTPVTALRRHPLEAVFSSTVVAVGMGIGIGIWVLVLGQQVMPYSVFGTLLGIWIWRVAGYNLRHSHIWISYGDFWNRIFISPAQHQVHHSKSPVHYDKNFGHIFSVWDMLFGTLYLPTCNERMTFGISDSEAHDYRSLFGLYVTPILKIWRRLRSRGGATLAVGD